MSYIGRKQLVQIVRVLSIVLYLGNGIPTSFISRKGHLYDDFSWEAGLKLD